MQWSTFTTGFVLVAALIVAIGAQNAFVLRQGLRREHVVAIVIFCALADFALIAAGVAGLASVLDQAAVLVNVLTIGGALFLCFYGVKALARALQPGSLIAAAGGDRLPLRAVMAQAAAFTFLNPHVYLDTVLLVGSIGGRQPAGLRPWFVGGAAAASFVWFSLLGFGARLLVPLFARPIAWRILDVLVGLTMLTMAALLLIEALHRA
jgi:L-lysine exporter family protein LysE/ArgO